MRLVLNRESRRQGASLLSYELQISGPIIGSHRVRLARSPIQNSTADFQVEGFGQMHSYWTYCEASPATYVGWLGQLLSEASVPNKREPRSIWLVQPGPLI